MIRKNIVHMACAVLVSAGFTTSALAMNRDGEDAESLETLLRGLSTRPPRPGRRGSAPSRTVGALLVSTGHNGGRSPLQSPRYIMPPSPRYGGLQSPAAVRSRCSSGSGKLRVTPVSICFDGEPPTPKGISLPGYDKEVFPTLVGRQVGFPIPTDASTKLRARLFHCEDFSRGSTAIPCELGTITWIVDPQEKTFMIDKIEIDDQYQNYQDEIRNNLILFAQEESKKLGCALKIAIDTDNI